MKCERKIYPATYHYVNGYKAIKTSGHDSGITIFIKKRFLGFLWWVFVKDRFGHPVTYNHYYNAEAFMNREIGYYDHLHHDWHAGGDNVHHVRKMTDDDAWNKITKHVEVEIGETPELGCVKKAWELDGKNYIHIAKDYAILWHRIYKSLGKKSWIKLD